MTQAQTSQSELTDICRAFHLTWDTFPTLVMLLGKDRTIRDVNAHGKNLGIVPGVIKCFELTGQSEVCGGCLANLALKESAAQRIVAYLKGLKGVYDTYWLPISGQNDLYIHYSTDISEHANPELFPK
jgi:hypothetical protein